MNNEEKYKLALELALIMLGKHEPGDSRAVSDEFVAMAAILSNANTSDDCIEIIQKAISADHKQLEEFAESLSTYFASKKPVWLRVRD